MYYDKIKEVVSLYILFIQIINSLKNIFSDNITIEGIDDKIEKLNKIRFTLYNRVDDDFTYEYKKLILLYVEYLFAILNYIFNDNGNADGIYELKQIGESYEENKGLQFFDNGYKKMYINKLKEASYNFCINMKKINLSFYVYNDNVSDKNTEFCNQIIKAIHQMKLHRPDYVRNYITNPSIALQEENFRDTIGFFFSAVFDVSSEEWRKEGLRDILFLYFLAEKWRCDMAVSYKKLFHLLIEKNMTNSQLQQEAGFSANIITRLKRGGNISLESVESICRVLNCGVDDILEFIPEDNGGKENG